MKNQKKAGILLSYVSLAIKLVVAFFYTPYLISHIGNGQYGIFNIVGSLLAYVAMVDFGINDTTLRYIIDAKKQQNAEASKQTLGSINIMYLGIGVLIILVASGIYMSIPSLFASSFTTPEISLTQQVFVYSAIGLWFTLVFNPLGAILAAYERFVFMKVLEIASYIAITGCSVFVLSLGYSLLEVMQITMAVTVLSIFIKMIYVWTNLSFPVYLKYFDASNLKKMSGYAAPIFIVIIVEQIYWKLDNIILGNLLSTSAVAIYAVGFFFQKYILNFASSISRVYIPSLISQIASGISLEAVTSTVVKIARMQLLIVLPVILVLSLFGKEFMLLWLGESYLPAYYVLLAAMIPFCIEIIGNVRNTVFQVNEMYWHRSRIILVISVLNVLGTILLVKSTNDIFYAALCTGLGLILGYILIHIVLWRKQLLNVPDFFRNVWKPGLMPITITIVCGIIINSVEWNLSWLNLGVKVIALLTIFAISVYIMYLNELEKLSVKSVIIKVLNRR